MTHIPMGINPNSPRPVPPSRPCIDLLGVWYPRPPPTIPFSATDRRRHVIHETVVYYGDAIAS